MMAARAVTPTHFGPNGSFEALGIVFFATGGIYCIEALSLALSI